MPRTSHTLLFNARLSFSARSYIHLVQCRDYRHKDTAWYKDDIGRRKPPQSCEVRNRDQKVASRADCVHDGADGQAYRTGAADIKSEPLGMAVSGLLSSRIPTTSLAYVPSVGPNVQQPSPPGAIDVMFLARRSRVGATQ